jgi:hypothetical protein
VRAPEPKKPDRDDFNIPSLIKIAEALRASGREWPENATYNGGFFDKAMALCESMPKPVIKVGEIEMTFSSKNYL